MTRRQRNIAVEAHADRILADEPSVEAYAAYFETQMHCGKPVPVRLAPGARLGHTRMRPASGVADCKRKGSTKRDGVRCPPLHSSP